MQTPNELLDCWCRWVFDAERITVRYHTLERLRRTAVEQNAGHAAGVPVPLIVRFKGAAWALEDEDERILRLAQPNDYAYFWHHIRERHPEILALAHDRACAEIRAERRYRIAEGA